MCPLPHLLLFDVVTAAAAAAVRSRAPLLAGPGEVRVKLKQRQCAGGMESMPGSTQVDVGFGRVGLGSGDLRVEVGWSRGIVTLDSRREDDTIIPCLRRISAVVAATLPRVLLAMTTC